MEVCPTPAALFLLSSAFNQFIQQNMWLSKKWHTYLLCVGAKSKLKANSGISCYHPACILKQHGHVGQCRDSFPSQDLAVTKYRVKKQTPLTTQVLVAQYHVVIWIPWIPSVQTSYLKAEEDILRLMATITKLIDLTSCSLSRDWPRLHKSPTSLISSWKNTQKYVYFWRATQEAIRESS